MSTPQRRPFWAFTAGCARCHDHKSDLILQRDYYAVRAVFAPAVIVAIPESLGLAQPPDRRRKRMREWKLREIGEQIQAARGSLPREPPPNGKRTRSRSAWRFGSAMTSARRASASWPRSTRPHACHR